MNPNPKSSKNKIAFTGTNSSGKTTMALEVTTRLKSEHHYLAEVVSSQDRKISWKDDHFPVDPRAHYGMITNLIHAEVAAELKGDADVVITDRSVLDLYSIALVDHPRDSMISALKPMVESWLGTYTKIFYLPPLAYQEDGKRPPNEFRMKTHASLINLLEAGNYPNVVMVSDRSTIMGSVRETLGIKSKNPQVLGLEIKLQHLANTYGHTLAVKDRAWPTSDLDIWCVSDQMDSTWELGAAAEILFGDSVKVQVMLMPVAGLELIQATHPVKIYRKV